MIAQVRSQAQAAARPLNFYSVFFLFNSFLVYYSQSSSAGFQDSHSDSDSGAGAV